MLNWTAEPGWRLMYDGYYQHPINGPEPYQNMFISDIVRLHDGSYRMYLGSFHGTSTEPYNMTRSAISPDLLNWTTEPGVRIDSGALVAGTFYSINAIFGKVLEVPGGFRMFFSGYNGTKVDTSPINLGNFIMHTAISPDGLNFVVEPGVRTFPNPEPWLSYRAWPSNILQLNDGSYRIYFCSPLYADGNGWFGVSSVISQDGLNWVNEPGHRWKWRGTYTVDDPVYPAGRIWAVQLENGGIRLFIGVENNQATMKNWIASLLSSDGLNFIYEPGNRLYTLPSSMPTDPVMIKIDGGYRMLYTIMGTQYPQRYGKIYSAVSTL